MTDVARRPVRRFPGFPDRMELVPVPGALFGTLLREIDDRSGHEVCAELGLTSDHFNRVLFRARNRYRELYRRRMEEKGQTR